MRKFFVIATLAALTFACSRKSTPTTDIIISNKAPQKDTVKVAATNNSETSAGKSIYTTRCVTCHGLKPVENYTMQQWENILKIMAPKAHLTEAETKDVTAYVSSNAKK